MCNQKNIIWFVVDQMRTHALSCHNDPNVHTPDGDYWRRGTQIDPRDQIMPPERTGHFKTWIGYENVNSSLT